MDLYLESHHVGNLWESCLSRLSLIVDFFQTRFPELDQPEKLRKGAEDFLDRLLNIDVALIFAPSQV